MQRRVTPTWGCRRSFGPPASVRHLAEALATLIEEGKLAPQPVEPLTHLLSGAMNEAALRVAGSNKPDDLAEARTALSRLLEALRVR